MRNKRRKSKVSFAPSEIGYEASQYQSASAVSDTTSFRTDSDMRDSVQQPKTQLVLKETEVVKRPSTVPEEHESDHSEHEESFEEEVEEEVVEETESLKTDTITSSSNDDDSSEKSEGERHAELQQKVHSHILKQSTQLIPDEYKDYFGH